MQALEQVNRFITVNTLGEDEFLAKSFLLSTDFEAVAHMIVEQSSLKINRAWWNIYRSPGDNLNGGKELPGLMGVEAHLNSGRELRRVVGEEANGLPRELLAECVKGIMHADIYVYKKRGFPTPQAYGEYWEKISLNACRYYNNLEQNRVIEWFDYFTDCERAHNLFNRSKSCMVYRQDDGALAASASFIDAFHELFLHVTLDSRGIVTAAAGNYLRIPSPVCSECSVLINNLIGNNITCFNKKEIGALVGGPQGCDHLVDIVYDLGRALEHIISY